MLDARHLAMAGLALALGVGGIAAGCANGTPTVDDTLTGGGDGEGGAVLPIGEGGVFREGAAVDGGGCRSKSECAAPLTCDTSTGTCVECIGDGDCPAGKVCDTGAKTCATGCNGGHPCESGKSCCNGTCAATNTVQACSACGLACDATHSTGASCNGTTCAYTGCGVGFGDCKTAAPNADGCETPTTTPTDCGSCGRACSTTNVMGTPTCTGGACNSACIAGYANCKQPVAGDGGMVDDGCETKQHANGLGQHYTDCPTPLGTPGDETTYTTNMASEAATASVIGGTYFPGGNCTAGIFVYACPGQQSGTTCAVWCVQGPNAGHVHQAASCACPTSSDPTWN